MQKSSDDNVVIDSDVMIENTNYNKFNVRANLEAYINKRLKNLQIGYTLPQDLTRKISIEKLRVYFSGENLWTGTSLRKQTVPKPVMGFSTFLSR